MKILINKQRGFTLIEMIAVLIIVGIMAAIAGLGIVTAVQGYILSKGNAAISEKALLAVAKINRELTDCYTCKCADTNNPNIATNPFSYSNPLGSRTITWVSGSPTIQLSGDTLIDGVNTFSMSYDSTNSYKSILVTLVLNHPSGGTQTFTTNVYPRNSIY